MCQASLSILYNHHHNQKNGYYYLLRASNSRCVKYCSPYDINVLLPCMSYHDEGRLAEEVKGSCSRSQITVSEKTDLDMGLPDSTPHWTTMVFHTGLCQSPLAVKHKMLKLDVICRGTGVIPRLISSLNSWTSVLAGQSQRYWIQVGTEPKGPLDEFQWARKNVFQTGAAACLLPWY